MSYALNLESGECGVEVDCVGGERERMRLRVWMGWIEWMLGDAQW